MATTWDILESDEGLVLIIGREGGEDMEVELTRQEADHLAGDLLRGRSTVHDE